MAVFSAVVAFPFAHRVSLAYRGDFAVQVLIVQMAIRSASVLALIVLLYSAVYAVLVRGR